MSNESSFLRTPRPQNDLVENAEVSQLRGLVRVTHHPISFTSSLPQQATTTTFPS